MAVPAFTPFTGLLPAENDPATFPARAEALFEWFTQASAQLAALSAFLDQALDGSGTLLDAVAQLQADLDRTALVPTGHVSAFYGTQAPPGFLKLDGAEHSRADHAALWAYAQASGAYDPTGEAVTMFGPGDGSTTFTLPEVRGEFLRAWDNGRGVDEARAIGSAQADAFAAHTHGIHGFSSPDDGGPFVTGSTADGATHQTDPAGGDETRPRNVAVLVCIKT